MKNQFWTHAHKIFDAVGDDKARKLFGDVPHLVFPPETIELLQKTNIAACLDALFVENACQLPYPDAVVEFWGGHTHLRWFFRFTTSAEPGQFFFQFAVAATGGRVILP